jgi:hypothetical protein
MSTASRLGSEKTLKYSARGSMGRAGTEMEIEIEIEIEIGTGLGLAGLGWAGPDSSLAAGLDWAGLGWAGLGWAGLDWTGLDRA